MQKQRTIEKYLLNDNGQVVGKETIVEFFSESDLIAKRDQEVIDAETIESNPQTLCSPGMSAAHP